MKYNSILVKYFKSYLIFLFLYVIYFVGALFFSLNHYFTTYKLMALLVGPFVVMVGFLGAYYKLIVRFKSSLLWELYRRFGLLGIIISKSISGSDVPSYIAKNSKIVAAGYWAVFLNLFVIMLGFVLSVWSTR